MSNYLQQGKDDRGPTMQSDLERKANQDSRNLLAKVQGMTQILVGSKSEGPRFESMHRPGFVYAIA